MVTKKDEGEKPVIISEPTFTKEQLLASKKYKHRKDALNVVLKDGKSYTFKQVDDRIEKFMKMKEQVK